MRFEKRWLGTPPKNLEKTLRRILRATEEIWKRPLANLKALIKYKKPARYFYTSGWVFVVIVDEDTISLTTAERYSDCPSLWEKKQKKSKKRQRKKRYRR